MKYELFDYQRAAAVDCIDRLARGRNDKDRGYLSSFALSAITGSGKTVIATAVIEGLLHGSADLEVEADPRATFLWVTDDPALNNQTRNKMLQASDLLQPARLRILDNDFLDSELSPGRVYFLNIQKLSKNAGLAQGGRNLRQHSMWDVLANTINGDSSDLYLVLDEAHRGMKPPRDRTSIVQRIISGEAASNPPVPVVWGISATIDRFTAAMKGISARTEYPFVQVDIDKVRASGLVKDEIGLDEPDESGTFGTTLLREAVASVRDFEQRWAAYAAAESEPEVLPIMVVQVADKSTPEKLADLVSVIESGWGLGPDAAVHVFGEHEAIELPGRTLRWVPPESIQSDTDIRVVFAKEAISTGWDCPRAEVLYSERPANDATHIAQVVGRMVRQPLARRIATDDALNTVACFLPNFNRAALGVIKAELEGRSGTADATTGADVVRKPVIFGRSQSVPAEAFELIDSLPSVPAPDTLVSPLRRARTLAKLLTDTASGSALLPGAGAQLTKVLNARLDGLVAEHAEQVEANIEDLKTTDIHRSRLGTDGRELPATTRQIATHMADLDRDTRRIINSIKEGAGKDYYKHRVQKAAAGADRLELRVEIAAFFEIAAAVQSFEARATEWVREQLDAFKVEIDNTTGARRDGFRRVQEQALTPEAVTVALRDNLSVATVDGDGNPLPMFSGHIYADENGEFPVASHSSWETEVIRTEIERPSFVGWYRNPSRATPAALRIAYQTDAGTWTSVQPDFLIVSRRDDGSLGASIVDPHGDYFADARNKLVALANFAEDHGDQFVRIESISKASSGLRSLDLKADAVRDLVRSFEGAEVASLYESSLATPYGTAS